MLLIIFINWIKTNRKVSH